MLAFALLASLAACDGTTSGAQQVFEDRALLDIPDGFTRTDENGAALNADADDWRIGPAFAARVRMLQVPFPNPAGPDETVSFTVDAQGVSGGLYLYRLRPDGVLEAFNSPGTSYPDASRPGFYTFTFFGSEASPAGVAGLYRLLLLDGAGRIVTYGDVRVE